jgi:hypothetical protein
MESEHMALLYDCEAHWLYYTNLLHGALELEEGTAIFLKDGNNNGDAKICYYEDFIQKLAYSVEIFEKSKEIEHISTRS